MVLLGNNKKIKIYKQDGLSHEMQNVKLGQQLKKRILLIEDDHLTAEFLYNILTGAGYDVTQVAFKDEAMLKLNHTYDLVILDLILPDCDGRELLNHIRASGKSLTVLVLTGLGTIEQKLAGLNDGADDYMTKPFDHRELLLRVRALLRRNQEQQTTQKEVDGLVLDDTRHCIHYGEKKIQFTHKEYLILRALTEKRGVPMTKEQLLDVVYPTENKRPKQKIIDVYIFKIRSKLEKEMQNKMQISTVWGVGLKLDVVSTDI